MLYYIVISAKEKNKDGKGDLKFEEEVNLNFG